MYQNNTKTAICSECGEYRQCWMVWELDGASFNWICKPCGGEKQFKRNEEEAKKKEDRDLEERYKTLNDSGIPIDRE